MEKGKKNYDSWAWLNYSTMWMRYTLFSVDLFFYIFELSVCKYNVPDHCPNRFYFSSSNNDNLFKANGDSSIMRLRMKIRILFVVDNMSFHNDNFLWSLPQGLFSRKYFDNFRKDNSSSFRKLLSSYCRFIF